MNAAVGSGPGLAAAVVLETVAELEIVAPVEATFVDELSVVAVGTVG